MTYEQILTMLNQTGLPVTYYHWENDAPSLPYIVFYYPQSNNMAADDLVYQRIDGLNIELYTKRKSFDNEENLESILKDWGMVWNKSESYLTNEEMYEVLYEMEIVIHDEN